MDSTSRKRSISHLDEINEPIPSAIIHGAITQISPIKKGRNSNFFDATLSDNTSSVRLVGFTPQQQVKLENMHKNKSPVEFLDCVIKDSRHGVGYDIMLKSNTKITSSPKKLDMDTITSSTLQSKPITLDTLFSLHQYERVTVNIKVLELQNIEEVGPAKTRKRNIIVADATATTTLVVWEKYVDALEKGKSYTLEHFHVKEFKNKKNLSMPKTDFHIVQIDDLKNAVMDIPPDDDKTIIKDASIIAIPELDK